MKTMTMMRICKTNRFVFDLNKVIIMMKALEFMMMMMVMINQLLYS